MKKTAKNSVLPSLPNLASLPKLQNLANLSLEKKREYAKVGMGVSLALTAGTALFMKNGVSSKLHTLSGIALIGFSLWHYSLYPKEKASKPQTQKA